MKSIQLKKTVILFLSFISVNALFSQQTKVSVIDKNAEIKNEVFYIRANKGDILRFNMQTEAKNEKNGKYYDLKNVKIYRQLANEEWQYIIDKDDVSSFKNLDIKVPSNGVYTLIIDRGGMTKFNTELKVDRIPENDSLALVKRKAIMVEVPDTIHTYTKDSVIYDYVRVSTPYLKKDTTQPFYEDQIFIDRAYALRMDNKYTIPIVLPLELYNQYKKQKSVKWGFFISVSDEVYKALQKKVVEVASAGVDAGVGKMMSGKTDAATGLVNKNSVQKAYEVFDKASTANEVAGIAGDASSLANFKEGEQISNAVATITGFSGLTEVALNKAADFIPKIEDQIIYKVISMKEYDKYLANLPYSCLQQGKGCYVSGTFNVDDPNEIFYLIIENERKTSGSALGVLETVGKTVLSQYVYLSLKVFVQKETVITYDNGYYNRQLVEMYNPKWLYKQEVTYKQCVIFEDEVQPYYKVLNSNNIY